MFVECPRCGGMMDHDVCEYCGCFDPTFRVRITPERVEPQTPTPAPQPPVAQPNVVVNNYVAQPAARPAAAPRYNGTSARLDYDVQYISKKNKWAAFVLCLFGGFFGLHYFYVGKIKMGLLYLFTFGLAGYGWFFHLFWIAIGKFKDARGYPLKR